MKILAWIALAFLAQSALGAQEICREGETIGTCFTRLSTAEDTSTSAEEVETVTPAATEENWKRLTSKATGPDVPEQGLESATEDFLPSLRFALALAGLGEGFDKTALNFERKIAALGTDRSWELKLKGTVNDPDVFEPLKMAFNEEIREDRVNTLKSQIEDLDDYSITLSANRGSERFGRTPNAYSQSVFQFLLQEVVVSSEDSFEEADAADFALLELGLSSETPIASLPADQRPQVEQRLLTAAQKTTRTIEALKERAEEIGLFQVADLLNNQPQINASGVYRLRDGVAGPDELSIKASYEYGFVNLNQLRRRCGEPNSSAFATCYQDYLDNSKAQIEKGDRLSITAEYNQVDAFRFALPADQVDLNLESQSGLVITAAYARYIPSLGDSSSRIDVTGKYESKDDRGVFTVNYTNRQLQALGGTIGISYANHERFLPDSDHVIGAHFGLSFKAFSKNPAASGANAQQRQPGAAN